MKGVRRVLGHACGLEIGEVEVHLGGRLGARGDLEDDAHTVDGLLLAGVRDVHRRWHERHRAHRSGHAEPDAHLTGGAGAEVGCIHVGGAA